MAYPGFREDLIAFSGMQGRYHHAIRLAPDCGTFCRAFADSKTLKDERREALFADIRGDGRLGYAIEAVSAAYISAKMLQRCALFPWF